MRVAPALGFVGAFFLCTMLLCSIGHALAQCQNPAWLPNEGLRGIDGKVDTSTLWHRDGPAAKPVLVVAGGFVVAGTSFATNIALWNGTAWEPLGAGIGGEVRALAELPNGNLVAAGSFRSASGVAVMNVASWDGHTWSGLGTGIDSLNAVVNAAIVTSDGDLVVGGFFSSAGGTNASSIARWDGNAWNRLGTGLNGFAKTAQALMPLPGGGLVAAGNFSSAGGISAANIAKWDGQAWAPLGKGLAATGNALALMTNGNVAAGGGGTFMWDGLSWTNLGTGMASGVLSLTVMPNGDLFAGGGFWDGIYPPSNSGNFIARWDGAAWQPIGLGMDNQVTTLLSLPDGTLFAGGAFVIAGGVHALHVATWDGEAWNFYGGGFGGNPITGNVQANSIYALARLTNNDVIAGGAFMAAGYVSATNIARWDGSQWFPLAQGINGTVRAVAVATNGDVIIGGAFTMAGNTPATNIARWDGSSWSPLGSGVGNNSGNTVYSLAILTNGDVVAGGVFFSAGSVPASRIARWNGTNWAELGSGMNSDVLELTVLTNGDLIAGGDFTTAGGSPATNIARWDGAAWSALGSGMSGEVKTMAVLPNGNLIVAGQFATPGGTFRGVARWDGLTWSPVGGSLTRTTSGLASVVTSVTVLANGDIVATGAFDRAGGVPVNNVARWDGSVWHGLGTGPGSTISLGYSEAFSLASLAGGGFVMGGAFVSASGVVSPCFAQWGCPVTTQLITLGSASLGQGAFQFSFQGALGKLYDAQYSTNLTDWSTVQSALPQPGSFQDTNASRTLGARGFYRLKQE